MLVLFRRLRSGSEKMNDDMNDELISIIDIILILLFICQLFIVIGLITVF